MFTLSQLCNCIEEALSPLTCEFTLCRDASLTLKVFDAESGRVDLVVTGISVNKLQTPQEVEKMVDELRYELQSNTVGNSGWMTCRCALCRSGLAREKRPGTAFIQAWRVIVDDLREQACSYSRSRAFNDAPIK